MTAPPAPDPHRDPLDSPRKPARKGQTVRQYGLLLPRNLGAFDFRSQFRYMDETKMRTPVRLFCRIGSFRLSVRPEAPGGCLPDGVVVLAQCRRRLDVRH